MARRADPAPLLSLAERQHGVLARQQALDHGFDRSAIRRRVAAGTWDEPLPGVLHVRGTTLTWKGRLLAACLCGGTDTMVSHAAAVALWGLEGARGGGVEVLSPRWQRLRRLGVRAHETRRLDPEDRAERFGIPVLAVPRALLTYAAVAHPQRVAQALDDARRKGLTSLETMSRRVDDLSAQGRNGIGVMREVLADRGVVPRSVFERKLAELVVSAGLPAPVRSAKVEIGTGPVYLDLAYPEHKIAIEADSEEHHLALDRFQHDRARQNLLVLDGWLVLRFTWRQVTQEPARVVLEVRRALSLRRRDPA